MKVRAWALFAGLAVLSSLMMLYLDAAVSVGVMRGFQETRRATDVMLIAFAVGPPSLCLLLLTASAGWAAVAGAGVAAKRATLNSLTAASPALALGAAGALLASPGVSSALGEARALVLAGALLGAAYSYMALFLFLELPVVAEAVNEYSGTALGWFGYFFSRLRKTWLRGLLSSLAGLLVAGLICRIAGAALLAAFPALGQRLVPYGPNEFYDFYIREALNRLVPTYWDLVLAPVFMAIYIVVGFSLYKRGGQHLIYRGGIHAPQRPEPGFD